MKSSHQPSSLTAIPRNSFRRTLLQPLLHNFCALAPVNHSDGITYRQLFTKSRKSFRRLLLSLFVPVSPLGAHSYEKMGGTPPDASEIIPQDPNYLSYLPLTKFAPKCPKKAPVFSTTYEPPPPLTTCVAYHLRASRILRPKRPSVSYHLQTPAPVTTSVAYHLQKRVGGRGYHSAGQFSLEVIKDPSTLGLRHSSFDCQLSTVPSPRHLQSCRAMKQTPSALGFKLERF